MIMCAQSDSAQGFNPVLFASLLRQYREASLSVGERLQLLQFGHALMFARHPDGLDAPEFIVGCREPVLPA